MNSCGTCQRKFEIGIPYAYQTEGLAAEVIDDTIECHNGSEFDTDVYVFVGVRPPRVKDGSICDDCIKKLIAKGRIKFFKSLPYLDL